MGGLFSMTPMGAQFGGALFTMGDPWFMMILVRYFGKEFKIWDKSATIHFRRRGRGTVKATFSMTEQQFAFIREKVSAEGKIHIILTTKIIDSEEEIVADIEKTIFIGLKTAKPPQTEQSPTIYRLDTDLIT